MIETTQKIHYPNTVNKAKAKAVDLHSNNSFDQ